MSTDDASATPPTPGHAPAGRIAPGQSERFVESSTRSQYMPAEFFVDTLNSYHPDALVCWDRDCCDLDEEIVHVSTHRELTVGLDGPTAWVHFVCDPVPHWDERESAYRRGYDVGTDRIHRVTQWTVKS